MEKWYREKFENQRKSLTFTVKDFIGSISFPGGRSWSTLSSMGVEGWGVEGGDGQAQTRVLVLRRVGRKGRRESGILRILCPALPCPQLFPPLNLFPSTAKRELDVLR